MSFGRCKGCPLQESPVVQGFGPKQCQVAFVGERPGRVEIKTGRPFTGPAGRLLDQALTEAKIDPESVFRTNVCACYEPTNRAPKPAESKACASRLLGELAALKPSLKVVVALGSVATKALLHTRKGVTWMRGRIL